MNLKVFLREQSMMMYMRCQGVHDDVHEVPRSQAHNRFISQHCLTRRISHWCWATQNPLVCSKICLWWAQWAQDFPMIASLEAFSSWNPVNITGLYSYTTQLVFDIVKWMTVFHISHYQKMFLRTGTACGTWAVAAIYTIFCIVLSIMHMWASHLMSHSFHALATAGYLKERCSFNKIYCVHVCWDFFKNRFPLNNVLFWNLESLYRLKSCSRR